MKAVFLSRAAAAILVALLVPLSGCGSYTLASLSGEVRYDNTPVAEGGIRVFPLQGTKGHGAAVAITGGRYAFPLESRLAPGRYRVEIHAMQKTGQKIEDIDEFTGKVKGMIEESAPLIPRRYNIESTLEIMLEPGSNTHDFLLTPP
jgi:hypothetical protein